MEFNITTEAKIIVVGTTITPTFPKCCGCTCGFQQFNNSNTNNETVSDTQIIPIWVNPLPVPISYNITTDKNTPIVIDLVTGNTSPGKTSDPDMVRNYTQPSHGAVTCPYNTSIIVNSSTAILNVTYTPGLNFVGNDSFEYVIENGIGGTGTGVVIIIVNPKDFPPVPGNDHIETPRNTPVDCDVLENDTDIDSNITLVEVGQPSHGSCVWNTTTNNITYTPDRDWYGTDNYTYVISDGIHNVTGNVTVVVGFVPLPPVAVSDCETVYQNTTNTIDPLVNDWDLDNETLTIIHVNCSHGTVTIINNTIVYVPNPGYLGNDTIDYTIKDEYNLTDSTVINVTVLYPPTAFNITIYTYLNQSVVFDVLNGSLGTNLTIGSLGPMVSVRGNLTILPNSSIEYTPPIKFIGNATYTYTVKDYVNTSSPIATITVIVYCDQCERFFPPVPYPDNATTFQNTPVDCDVLKNDVAVDFDIYVVGVGQGQHGNVTFDPATNLVTYTPNHDYHGQDNFTYVVSNGIYEAESNVTVTVVFVPYPPVAVADNSTVYQNHSVVIDVLENDWDEDGDNITIIHTDCPEGATAEIVDNKIVFTPPPGFVGNMTFEYTITDPYNLTANATVTVMVPYYPTANPDYANCTRNEFVVINPLDNDLGTSLTIVKIEPISVPEGGNFTLYPNQSIVYIPPPNFVGIVNYTYQVEDFLKTVSNESVITINVTNLPPVAVSDNTTTLEDAPVDIDVLTNDYSPVNAPLTVVAVENGAHGTVTFNTTTNNVTYVPDKTFYGTDNFTYTITDGYNNATANVTVTIVSTNRPPEPQDDNVTMYQDHTVSIDVLQNDSDPDNDTLTIVDTKLPDETALVEIIDDHILFTPPPSFVGNMSFDYTVNDGNGANGTATVHVTVLYYPTAIDDNATTFIDVPVTINILDNDLGTSISIVFITPVDAPVDGQITILPDNSVVFTYPPDFTGNATYNYQIQDYLNTTSNVANITIVVEPYPIPVNDTATTTQNNPVEIDILANDIGRELLINTVEPVTQVNDNGEEVNIGTITFIPNATATYTPPTGFTGIAVFVYDIVDYRDIVSIIKANITITVTPTTFIQQTTSNTPMAAGAIAGLVVGLISGCCCLVLAALALLRRRKKKKAEPENAGAFPDEDTPVAVEGNPIYQALHYPSDNPLYSGINGNAPDDNAI